MKISRLIIATHNSGKLVEFRGILAPTGWEIAGLSDVGIDTRVEETGETFAANARLKAVVCSKLTSEYVLGDDSGLEVAALDGRPGLHTARYAGPDATDRDRMEKLLREMEPFDEGRDARYVCALALARQGELLLETQGECRGVIARKPRGRRGFGYDPIFAFPDSGRTYAELSEEEKNRHSHRAAAVRRLLRLIRESDRKE